MTTTTIDCDTCPVRGRFCGDCFVPVLGRVWLGGPLPREEERPAPDQDDDDPRPVLPLDSDELASVSAFVRAGLVHPDEAARATARAELRTRTAVG